MRVDVMEKKNINIGDPVCYIPVHLLKGSSKEMIQDKNLGIVTSKNDTYVFVRYKDCTGSQATRPEDLYSLSGRPDLQEKLGVEILPNSKINQIYLEGKKLLNPTRTGQKLKDDE